MKLDGKLALVTGGTDGIGAQLIRQLRAAGAQVITSGLNAERIAATAADGFEVVGTDLSTPEGVEALIAALAGRPLDILVNNAGMGDGEHDHRKGLPDAARAAQAIALNLTAPIRLITALMPTLRVAAEQRGGAMLVNVTSGLLRDQGRAAVLYSGVAPPAEGDRNPCPGGAAAGGRYPDDRRARQPQDERGGMRAADHGGDGKQRR